MTIGFILAAFFSYGIIFACMFISTYYEELVVVNERTTVLIMLVVKIILS